MKKLIILFTVMYFVCNANAQDKLITQSGDVKIVYNVEVGANKVFYTLGKKENAPIQQIAKKEVLTIIHSDGTKELFNTGEASTPQPATSPTTPTSSVSTSSTDRHPVVVKQEEYVPVPWTPDEKDLTKKKTAMASYFLYRLKSGSIIADDNVEAECKIGAEKETDPTPFINDYNFYVTIRNKSNKTIYIDLGNTFFVKCGESIVYYTPSSTSTGNGQSAGVGVNLGGIGNALGVGGAAGSVLGAIGVGGSSSKTSVTTSYAQRILAVPPMSQKVLDTKIAFPRGSHFADKKVNIGDSFVFDENNSPINFSSYITYSLIENCAEINSLQLNFYVTQIIGLKRHNGWHGLWWDIEDKLPDWSKKPHFILVTE